MASDSVAQAVAIAAERRALGYRACRLGQVVVHPGTATPTLLMPPVDDPHRDAPRARLSLDMPVCGPHRGEAAHRIRESWAEIERVVHERGGRRPDLARAEIRWDPIQ